MDGFHYHELITFLEIILTPVIKPKMLTEIRNWHVVLKAMESVGATSSQMYLRVRALADGKLDSMPTSLSEAPFSISAVAG